MNEHAVSVRLSSLNFVVTQDLQWQYWTKHYSIEWYSITPGDFYILWIPPTSVLFFNIREIWLSTLRPTWTKHDKTAWSCHKASLVTDMAVHRQKPLGLSLGLLLSICDCVTHHSGITSPTWPRPMRSWSPLYTALSDLSKVNMKVWRKNELAPLGGREW